MKKNERTVRRRCKRKEPFICVKLPVKKAFRNVGEKIIYA